MKNKSFGQYLLEFISIMSYKRYVLLSLLVILPVTVLQVAAIEYGVRVLQIIATALYLVYWMVYGFYTGYNKAKNFLIFSFIFWGLSLCLIIIHNTIKPNELLEVFQIYTVIIPMYGLHYYIYHSHMVSLLTGFCLIIIPPITCSMLGYLLGVMKCNLNLKREKS